MSAFFYSFSVYIWIEHEKLHRTDTVSLKFKDAQCTESSRKKGAHVYPIEIQVVFRYYKELSILNGFYLSRF